ncbi:plasmid stabilization system [Candidatus Scalindua japonica]|uniref:Plasmid stabilization system n=1 Tax=Candidatus Scalindua japonica TaxID=1284222 RepID=A0A286TWA0_9BACT|nr:type II toxin-antitoxin system RelE/ParE family toxin [Candidatus Scalindua japonica]GAX60160.1 plasmid stabilization system [Candidatus Scalindua japonica]
MHKLRYLEQAKDDLIQIKRYIAKESGSQEVALQYTSKLRQQCIKLACLPGQIGRPRPELMKGLRSFVHGNYVILFMYNNDFLDIVTIIEGHRDIEVMFEDL